MKKLKLTLFAGVILFATAPTAAAKTNWIKVESKNFVLVGDASEQNIKEFAAKLEQFRLSLTTLFPNLKIETPLPTRVYVFRDGDSFRPYKPIYQGKVRENVAGYFLARGSVNVIALAADRRWGDPLQPVFHEYEHFILKNNLGAIPTWLDEGMSEFYSTFYSSAGGKKATIGDPLSAHVDLFRHNSIWPLARLFAVDRRSPDYNESSKVGIFYAQSWALVHYLLFQDIKNGTNQFAEFIELLSTEIAMETAFQMAFKRDYAALEAELRRYVTRLEYPVMDVVFREQLIEPKDLTAVKISEAEAEFFAGELNYHLFRWPEAEAQLNRSLILDANQSPAHRALALLRWNQDRPEEAKREYLAAIKIDPQNYQTYLSYGILLGNERRNDESLTALKKALELNPDAPAVHYQLGQYFSRMGKDEAAVTEFSTANRLDDRSPEYSRALAVGLLRLGRGNFAARAARSYLRLHGWDAPYSKYMIIVATLGHRKMGQNAEADTTLKLAMDRLKGSVWPFALYRFLKAEISDSELLSAATDNEQKGEAHSYLGYYFAFSGKPIEAREHFEWVIKHSDKRYIEFYLSTMELARPIAADKNETVLRDH